jgi:hypothetical protein
MPSAARSARNSTPVGAGSAAAAWPRAREGPRPRVGGHPGRHVAAAERAREVAAGGGGIARGAL